MSFPQTYGNCVVKSKKVWPNFHCSVRAKHRNDIESMIGFVFSTGLLRHEHLEFSSLYTLDKYRN